MNNTYLLPVVRGHFARLFGAYYLRPLAVLMILSALVFADTAIARNSFLVAPGRVNIDLSRPMTQSFIITNNGDEKIRLSIDPVYFAVDSKSLAAGEPIGKHAAGYDDLHEFVRVSPRALSLRPGQRRDIRISIRSPGDLDQGDYRAHLLVRMVETAMTVSSGDLTDPNTMGMQLNVKMETGVALYGHMGERNPQIDFQCRHDESGNVLIQATNTSPWLFDGWVRLFPKGAVEGQAPLHEYRLRSIRESRTETNTHWKHAAGELEILWEDPSNEVVRHHATCSVAR